MFWATSSSTFYSPSHLYDIYLAMWKENMDTHAGYVQLLSVICLLGDVSFQFPHSEIQNESSQSFICVEEKSIRLY